MPLFDFVCNTCNTIEERLVKHSEITEQVCKDCGKEMVKSEQVSKLNFALKGVWFKTHKRY